jgi:ABC-type dipeptide/oligopeptide/nickel transport system permease component
MKKRSGLGIFLTKRLIKLVTLLVAICIVTFVLLELSPIDPVTAYVGASTKVGAEQRALIAKTKKEQWWKNMHMIAELADGRQDNRWTVGYK